MLTATALATLLALALAARPDRPEAEHAPADGRPAVRGEAWALGQHDADGGFCNPWHEDTDDVPPLRAAQWLLGRPFHSKPHNDPAPRTPLAPEAVTQPVGRGVRATWLGHSTVLLQYAGLTLLLDPIFSERASPVAFAGPKREVALPLDPDSLPRVDVVLLSHDHYDHLDLPTIRRLHERDRPLFVVPLGVGHEMGLPESGARIVELDWGRHVELADVGLPPVRVTATPAKHFSGRGLTDRNGTLWAGYYLTGTDGAGAPLPATFYAGDTGYSPHFRLIRARLGTPRFVVMPVGAYEPRWFMARVHVSPDEALQAFEDVAGGTAAAEMLAVHWGTFDLADEPLDEPARLLPKLAAQRHLDAARLHVLPVGGQVRVEG